MNIYCILFVQLHWALTEHNTPIQKKNVWKSLSFIMTNSDQSRNTKQLVKLRSVCYYKIQKV